jgi:FkbM family methyltransferase
MNQDELSQLRDASGLFNQLLCQVNQHLERSYPRVTQPGSQQNEDDLLGPLLPGMGTYVDIGAAEPVQCSNTWSFYQRGWRGLLIEPLFWYWPALLRQRPGDFLYDAAVRHYNGVTRLRVDGAASSVMPGWDINSQSNLLVPCETTRDVLGKFPQIRKSCRLCSIDVEGAEKEVLRGIDWTTFHPDVFCVEYRLYDSKELGEDVAHTWEPILIQQGYQEVARTRLNIIFQRKDLIEAKEKEEAKEVAQKKEEATQDA